MRWRLLVDGALEGASNMAIDEALYRSVEAGVLSPTLRLYSWSPPALSLGFRQCAEEACDREACRRRGVAVVRRMSGGRAVLHDRELTFSFAAGTSGPFHGRSVRETYLWVCRVLRAALSALKVDLDPPAGAQARRPPEPPPHMPCFGVPSGHEISARGKKLVGIAQKRGRRGFLQHGSLLLAVDRALWSEVTRSVGMELAAVGIAELAARPVTREELAQRLIREFTVALGAPPSDDRLSSAEQALARRLEAKYASSDWTLHRREPVEVMESTLGDPQWSYSGR